MITDPLDIFLCHPTVPVLTQVADRVVELYGEKIAEDFVNRRMVEEDKLKLSKNYLKAYQVWTNDLVGCMSTHRLYHSAQESGEKEKTAAQKKSSSSPSSEAVPEEPSFDSESAEKLLQAFSDLRTEMDQLNKLLKKGKSAFAVSKELKDLLPFLKTEQQELISENEKLKGASAQIQKEYEELRSQYGQLYSSYRESQNNLTESQNKLGELWSSYQQKQEEWGKAPKQTPLIEQLIFSLFDGKVMGILGLDLDTIAESGPNTLFVDLILESHLLVSPFLRNEPDALNSFLVNLSRFDRLLFRYLEEVQSSIADGIRGKLSSYLNSIFKPHGLEICWPVTGEAYNQAEQMRPSDIGTWIDQVRSASVFRNGQCLCKALVTTKE